MVFRDLKTCERAVLVELACLSDELGQVDAEIDLLVRVTGMARSSVYRAIAGLVDSGALVQLADGGYMVAVDRVRAWLGASADRELVALVRSAKLTARSRLVFLALAGLVDAGERKGSVRLDEVKALTGYSRASIYRSLREGVDRGICGWNSGSPGVIEIAFKTGNPGKAGKTGKAGKAGETGNAGVAGNAGEAGLAGRVRDVARACMAGESDQVGQLLRIEGEGLFGCVAGKRTVLPADQRLADTLTVAFDVMVTECERIECACSPVSLWRVITQKACSREDQQFYSRGEIGGAASLDEISDHTLSRDVCEQGFDPARRPSVDRGVLSDARVRWLVDALVDCGVSRAVAGAGTLRVLRVIRDNRISYQHTAAAKDAWFAMQGISESAARAWVSALIGVRGKEELVKGSEIGARQGYVEKVAAALRN